MNDLPGQKTIVSRYISNPAATPVAQVIYAFTLGALLSPWASGIFFLIVFLIVWEIFYYIFTWGDPRLWQLETRAGVICASVLGYIIGRTAIDQEILIEGVPDPEVLAARIENELKNPSTKGWLDILI